MPKSVLELVMEKLARQIRLMILSARNLIDTFRNMKKDVAIFNVANEETVALDETEIKR